MITVGKEALLSGLLLLGLSGQTENCIVDIVPGDTTAVEIKAEGGGVITLRMQTASEDEAAAPTVKIQDQSEGYACAIQSVNITNTNYNSLTGVYTETREILVSWNPGQGPGGCTVDVQLPNNVEASAHLYKN